MLIVALARRRRQDRSSGGAITAMGGRPTPTEGGDGPVYRVV
jgi:hypothetical protein